MICLKITVSEIGPYNAGTPGIRPKAAVQNAQNFIDWLEAEGWSKTREDEDSVWLIHEDVVDQHTAESILKVYGSKPLLKDGSEAWTLEPYATEG